MASGTELTETFGDELAEVESFKERCSKLPFLESEDVAMRLALQTLASETPEEVGKELESRTVTSMRLQGRVLTLQSMALSDSSFAKEPTDCPYYCGVEAVTEDGETIVFSIGGWGPVSQLVRWQEQGAFPIRERVVEIPSRVQGRNAAFRFVNA